MIETNQQDLELERLRGATKYERCFFVVNINDKSISISNGIKEWLGYLDEEFSFENYTTLIHHHHRTSVMLFNKAIFNVSRINKNENNFKDERYVSEIAVRHANGLYLNFKLKIRLWNFDDIINLPKAYLYEFMFLGEYESECNTGIKPRITDFKGMRLLGIEKLLRENLYDILESEKCFSIQELRIIRKYAYNIDVTTYDISQAFKISHNTVNIYNRRIIEKFIYLYPNTILKTAKEVSQFLRKENYV